MNETGTSSGADPGAGYTADASARNKPGHRVLWWIATITACLLALVTLAVGGWALWMDQVDRDSDGFISIGETTGLETETSAIVSELKGDGPNWLYGSTVLGDARVRVTSQNEEPVFVGIAPTDDVTGFLDGAGYATIEHLETADLTTHEGPELTTPPSEESIWAASTEGSGEQTLLWDTRDGDWSIVLMNADAGAGVAVTGDVSARFPLLPWLAGGFLLAGAALAVLGGWLLVLGIRRETRASQLASGPQPTAVQKEVAQ